MSKIDSIWVSSTDIKLSDLNSAVDSLQCQLNTLQAKNDYLMGVIETANDSVANQLSAASYLLAIIAIVIAIVGGVLGYYIGKKKRQIEAISATIDEKGKTINKISEAIKELDKQIKGNLSELYKKLRNEETKAILDRLVFEPRDIGNLIKPLFVRDLDEEGFSKLREAYFKLKSEPEDEQPKNGLLLIKIRASADENYILLFFQHYSYLALKDDQIRPSLVESFEDNCQKAFKRDLIKTTIDICNALNEDTSTFNKEEVLTAYLKALNMCKYRKLEDLRNIFEQNITKTELLKNAIEKCTAEGVYLELFGIKKLDVEIVKSQEEGNVETPTEDV